MTIAEDVGIWVNDGPSALVMKEYLAPVEGAGEPFFPPTYAGTNSDDESSYCIDTLSDGTRICLIDSVGSQANRMEPIFMKSPYNDLIPQITITAGTQKRNLCEVGHRAGDALLRHSEIYSDVSKALETLKNENDARPLAKVAPTSLVFGVWDSRKTQAKVPRIVSSVIRAYDVEEMTRSAQYFPPVDYRQEDLLGDKPADTKKRSSAGFNENPATGKPGGIIAKGGIRRDVVVNLAALRKLHGGEETTALRKYILGLALVAATAELDLYLRQGCILSRDPEKPKPEWTVVYSDGQLNTADLAHEAVKGFATDVATKFGVGEDKNATFNVKTAEKEIAETKSNNKKSK